MKDSISKVIKRYNYLHSELDVAYHEISLKLGLSDSAMIILYTICDIGDGCLLREICHRSGLSKQTLNSALRKLEAEGIVYLKLAGSKNKMVCLTEEGKGLVEQTAKQIMNVENEIFASWTEEEIEKYLEMTERFLVAFQEKTKNIQVRRKV